jgi:nucleoid DNA-binding protein
LHTLNPRKPKQAIKKTAQAEEVSEQLVSDLTHYFWLRVRKDVSSLDYPRVQIANFGSFMVRYNRMEKQIKKYEEILGKLNMTRYRDYQIFDELSSRVAKMKELTAQLIREREERSKHYDIKNANRGPEDNLEEPEADSGGSEV